LIPSLQFAVEELFLSIQKIKAFLDSCVFGWASHLETWLLSAEGVSSAAVHTMWWVETWRLTMATLTEKATNQVQCASNTLSQEKHQRVQKRKYTTWLCHLFNS
jgi:hypothetical protein